jgi:TonB family protein
MNIDFNTGKVRSVTILRSTGSYGLDKEAVFALRQWRFKPGKLTRVEMPITFYTGGTLDLPPGARLVPNR